MVLHRVHFAFPVVLRSPLGDLVDRSHDDVAEPFKQAVAREDKFVLANQTALGLESLFLLSLHNFVVGVAHYSYDHVEHH